MLVQLYSQNHNITNRRNLKKERKKNVGVNTWTFVNFIKYSLEGLYLCF